MRHSLKYSEKVTWTTNCSASSETSAGTYLTSLRWCVVSFAKISTISSSPVLASTTLLMNSTSSISTSTKRRKERTSAGMCRDSNLLSLSRCSTTRRWRGIETTWSRVVLAWTWVPMACAKLLCLRSGWWRVTMAVRGRGDAVWRILRRCSTRGRRRWSRCSWWRRRTSKISMTRFG